MSKRVTRDARRSRKPRVPQPGAGIRRSQIRTNSTNRLIQSQAQFPERPTVFGQLALVTTEPYEIGYEVMAAGASTGTIYNDTGTLTVIGRIGILHISKIIEGQEQYGKITEGNFVTFQSGEWFSLATGENPVDFIRIQTPKYLDGIKSVTPPVLPNIDPRNLHIATRRPPGVDTESLPVHRASYSKSHRARIGAQLAQDRNQNGKRRGVTREARVPKSAEEVLNRSEFHTDAGTVTGINPRPIGAMAAEMEMQAAVQLSQIPVEQPE